MGAAYQRYRWQRQGELATGLELAVATWDAVYARSALELERIGLQHAALGTDNSALPGMAPPPVSTGVTALAILRPNGEALRQWADAGPVPAPSAETVAQALLQIADTKSPHTAFTCDEACGQHAFAPFYSDGQELVVVVTRPAAEILADFEAVATADVALLGPPLPTRPDSEAVTVWNRNVYSATRPDVTLPVLRQAATLSTASGAAEQVTIGHLRRSYSVTVSRLPGVPFLEAAVGVVIDSTAQLAASRASLNQALLHGGAGLLLSIFVVGLAMTRPSAAGARPSAGFPVSAATSSAPAVDEAGRRRAASVIATTTPVNQSTIDRLAASHRVLQGRATALRSEVRRVTAERAALQALVDSAQMILVVHTEDGEVQYLNRYGGRLTGWTLPSLNGEAPYAWLHCEPAVRKVFWHELRDLYAGLRRSLLQEAVVQAVDGARRRVTWRHRLVTGSAPGKGTVLSMGLDVTERLEAKERLLWLSHNDPVTGLFNRQGFVLEADKQLRTAKPGEPRWALIIVEIDHFAETNAAIGFAAGDKILAAVAYAITDELPAGCICARASGAQFVALMPFSDRSEIDRLVSELTANLSRTSFYADEERLFLSTSIGVALAPDDGSDTAALLHAADLAVTEAQAEGRGQFRFFDASSSPAHLRKGGQSYKELEGALSEGRLELHYQPILDHRTWLVSHYEALLRIRTRDGELHAPAEYLAAAEWTGHLRAIDVRVLSLAAKGIAAGEIPDGAKLGVNLSGLTLQSGELVSTLTRLFARTGVDPRRLVLEILETTALRSLSSVAVTLAEIKRMGCSLAVDDFGVGFTSFEYLRELPVDYIKIDRSFTARLLDRAENQKLMRSMNAMTKSLGKWSIAEGVEDADSLALLLDMGVDYSQGYYIGRPIRRISELPPLPERPIPLGDGVLVSANRTPQRPRAEPAGP